jgi:hypothetical protein
MSSLNRRARAPFVLLALMGLTALSWVDARAENPQPTYQHRPAAQRWQGARRETALREARRARAMRAHPSAGGGFYQRRQVHGRFVGEARFGGGGGVRYVSRVLDGGQVRVVRYGDSGTFERTIRPGLVSRTFVAGGHVLYAHAYQRHLWHQYGRAFAYETFVPAVRYPGVYYRWALAAWAHPVLYRWGWQGQPWYPMYGALFTPYPVYTSPDLWMTDYIIAQSLQTAYQAQGAAPGQSAVPAATSAAPPDIEGPAAESVAQPDAAPPAPAALPAPQPGELPVAPVAPPPAITPQIKAQLDEQIKVQLQEQQAAAAAPATLTTQTTPPALRPNHVFFQVVQPLTVPSGQADHDCSLGPNDYIRRTGAMSTEDWMIPVVVELSGSSDCPAGLQTRIGLNDLNAMENEQEAQVMEAMQAASKSMGSNGPPSGPGMHPTLIAAGSATPDPSALEAIRKTQ